MPVALPWMRIAALPLGLFAIAMFASFWEDRRDPGAIFWFGLAGALGYAAAALLINRTLIEIRDGWLVVKHRPLLFPGKRLRAADVKDVIVNSFRGFPRNCDEATDWELTALLRDGRSVRLTWGPMASHRADLLDQAAAELRKALASSHQTG